jgi:WD40 repeat protein
VKKNLTLLLILIPLIISAYTIEETLAQIEYVKKEISHNEQVVEEKIITLRKSNPLFAGQDPFESSSEYAERLKKGQPLLDNIREQYVGNLLQKKRILQGRIFQTENISLTLGEYDPDSQIYPVTISHLDYHKEVFDFNLEIGREKAKLLYNNLVHVRKTGILTIGIGNNIDLAEVRLEEPISGFIFQQEINTMLSFTNEKLWYTSASFSSNGKFLAIGAYPNKQDQTTLYDLENRKIITSYANGVTGVLVAFSTNNRYLITEVINENMITIYNIETGKINEVNKKDGSIYSMGGELICSLDTINKTSPDGRYEIRLEGPESRFPNELNIYRTSDREEGEVFAQHVVSLPPSLAASVSFSEPSGNQYLDALEIGYIDLIISNIGKGPGKGLTIMFNPVKIDGLNYKNSYIVEIPSGETITVKIPVEANIDVAETNNLIRINFDEINGFPPTPVEIEFPTRAYLKPEMFVIDVGIEDNNNNGMIESGETTKLTVRIGNKGKGFATDSYATFYSEDNVYITDSYPKIVSLGDLEYNKYIDVPIEFFVNDKAPEKIPLFVDITEATGIAGVDHLRIPISKTDSAREIKRTIVTGIDESYGDLELNEDLSIDIEDNIPSGSKRNDILAIIFGIEKYKNISNVSFANRDARFIKEYFSKSMGIGENNIYYITNEDVSKAEFDKVFSSGGWLDKRVKKGQTEIYFYYAGHGAPDIKENKAYLIPYDGDPNYASQTGYKMEDIYDNLAVLNAKSVTVFLDACFTGANRESEMLLADARPLMIEVKSPIAHGITVFSATGSKEISSAWREKKHGLFSYFLMKGMQGDADVNNDKKLTIKELGDYIHQKVTEQAGFLDREQTPEMISNDENRILINY